MFDASGIHHQVFVRNSPIVGGGIADCVAPFRTGVAHRLAGPDAAPEKFREADCQCIVYCCTIATGAFVVPPLLCPIWVSNAPGGQQSPLVYERGSTLLHCTRGSCG